MKRNEADTLKELDKHGFFRICEQKVKQNGSMMYYFSDNTTICIIQVWPDKTCDIYRPDNNYLFQDYM